MIKKQQTVKPFVYNVRLMSVIFINNNLNPNYETKDPFPRNFDSFYINTVYSL